MVWMTAEHTVRPIKLLDQQYTYKRVGKGQPRQGPLAVRPCEHGRREAIRATDQEGQVPSLLRAVAQPGRQLQRTELLPVFVQGDDVVVLPQCGEQSLALDLDGALRGAAAARPRLDL